MELAETVLYKLAKKMSSGELAHSEEQKQALKSDENYASFRQTQIQQVTDKAAQYNVPLKGKVVLDLGCNDGTLTPGYLHHGARHVIGVDVDAKAIKHAQENYTSDKVEFHLSTIDGIPLPDNHVDSIVCFDVFEHVEKPAELLVEIHRILKPGGKMLIGTWGWHHPYAPHLWSTMPVPYAHVFFSERRMLRVCKRVYNSDWYSPTFHDFDKDGNRIPDKYSYEEIPTDYLNKYLVKDFERGFKESDLDYEMYPIPFGSKFASWTKVLLNVPWIREFVIGYLWVVLVKPEQAESTGSLQSKATVSTVVTSR